MNWWRTRYKLLVNHRDFSADRRAWAGLELVCGILTIITLALLISLVAAKCVLGIPGPVEDLAMFLPIALAGAIGYGTNFLAVQMLFHPRYPVTWFPMSHIWPQGLIPARREELTELVARQISTRLLDKDAIRSELDSVLEKMKESDEAHSFVVESFVNILLDDSQQSRGARDEFYEILTQIAREKLSNPTSKRQVARLLSALIVEEHLKNLLRHVLLQCSNEIIDLIRIALRRYQKDGNAARDIGLEFALESKILNWKSLKKSLKKTIESKKSDKWMTGTANQIKQNLPEAFEVYLDETLVSRLYTRIREIQLSTESLLSDHEKREELRKSWNDAGFGRLVEGDLIPAILGSVQELVRRKKADFIVDLFDIEERVKTSAAQLELEELEDMVNQVGAYHLGAIQVLGFFLGLSVGAVMTLLS